MNGQGAALIWCPFADEASAAAVAGALLDEGLVACVNILPAVRSLYIWQGARGEGAEVGALFKTRADLLEAAIARIAALHPYEAPAVVGWHCDGAAAPTLAWLGALTGG
ncbi:MAG TPA: divalent-cation tolerance protein CutA [Novosphingobium sp.]|nr:divalent-cation tolerance protein CutA [Novosphingobium sp.]HZV11015.1 divalent-cation tolerance protein CutA [Novosphingobium sp.]